jgi:guanylate kinase
VLLDIDVQGAELLRMSFPHQCCRIFVSPPSLEELEFRLRARGTDSEASIQKRLANAREEMTVGKNFDFIVVNDSIERAYGELRNLLENQFGMKLGRETNG